MKGTILALAVAVALMLASGCTPQKAIPSVSAVEEQVEADKHVKLVAIQEIDKALSRQIPEPVYGQRAYLPPTTGERYRAAHHYVERLFRIASRIKGANAEFCHATVKSVGWNVVYDEGVNPAIRDDFKRHFGPGGVKVRFVTPGGPAERAGILPGDRLVSINDYPIRPGAVVENYAHVMGMEEGFERAARTGIADVAIRRGDVEYNVKMPLYDECHYRVYVKFDSSINAFATREFMVVYTGLMDFVTDDELAVVVGHELAHHTEQHIYEQQANVFMGTLAGLAIGSFSGNAHTTEQWGRIGQNVAHGVNKGYSPEFEAEADYTGLYFTARAGYDVDVAKGLWRKFSLNNPKAIHYAGTHPTNPKRALIVEKTAQEIAERRGRGETLIPKERNQ